MDIDRATGALVLRADSLMQKRRSFIATPRPVVAPPANPAEPLAPPSPAVEPAPAGNEDDLPVLTEVIPPEATPAAMPAAAIEEALAHRLASELAQAVGERLEAELPALIDASFARIEGDLRRDLRAIAENALKDFLARRQQLPAHEEPPARD
ncbi:hypothetical protein [Rhodocyclus tenuis]|uniref:DUF2497 domain-containing protein n=1 Tax=Rhodocyclus tenuis TaxID=1066 RepID=A0A840FY73_RHOTE|nr:hypothetical protein [Rhodocyclus tenuis]MBB4246784.1 hypothetical protein [Rhodocyclus tenuis]